MSSHAKPAPVGKMFIKTGDRVQIISGKDKGREGIVTRVYPVTGKVVIDGLNIVIKHKKGQPTPTNPNPESGKVEVSAPIPTCKVALLNADGKPTRIRMQINPDGTKTRVAVKVGQVIPDTEK